MTIAKESGADLPLQQQARVVIRFAGDSGDGMQITGNQFTSTSALMGNDLATLPDYPAEIRAPAGTRPGVSGFQIHFSSLDIHTPGDAPDILVVMNPAALAVNLKDLKPGGTIIANTGNFKAADLKKARVDSNPLEDHSLDGYRLIKIDINDRVARALEGSPLTAKEVQRCKNFFALGLMYWLYSRPLDPTIHWLEEKFAKRPEIAEANKTALRSGYNAGDIHEMFQGRYEVPRCNAMPKGTYRNIMGNQSLAIGLVAGAECAGLRLFLGSYPITPASDILHQLSTYKHFGVTTLQAEDEIAAICSAVGASYAGQLGVTTTSGPGLALKTETIGLAVALELPLVIVNVQRAGPSTGMPTKVEQADLMQAIFGRNGEAPIPVLAPAAPSECFEMAVEACRIAVQYMTPILLLSDNYLANGSEPWKLPDLDALERFPVQFRTDPEGFQPYLRNGKLARPWARPGTPGLEHRIGGLEKENVSGNISHDPDNHELMTRLRQDKVMGIRDSIPTPEVVGPAEADLLIVGWGSTYGAIQGAAEDLRSQGLSVANLHLRHLWPLPKGLDGIFSNFRSILVPEINMGQLVRILRSECRGHNFMSFPKMLGRPFSTADIACHARELLEQ